MEYQSDPRQLCLKWTKYETSLMSNVEHLLATESFVDCTLACDGHNFKVHKVVLSACSPYFQTLLIDNPCEHPVIILKDVNHAYLKLLIEFMYRGEVCAADEQIPMLLGIASTLKIRGLTDVKCPDPVKEETDYTPPAKMRHIETDKKNHFSDISRTLSPVDDKNFTRTVDEKSHFSSFARTLSAERNLSRALTAVDEKLKLTVDPSILSAHNSNDSNDAAAQFMKVKIPLWTQVQLREAIQAVVSQRMTFSQAAASFSIPKGTLYDNILGKTKRMLVLDEAALSCDEENAVLEYCCKETARSYKRRTKTSLADIIKFVEGLRRSRDPGFAFTGLAGFRWWWAFCKKHSIISAYSERDPASVNEDTVNTSNEENELTV